MAIKIDMNRPLPKNEIVQWVVFGVTIAVAAFTFTTMWHQIKLSKMQIDDLRKKHELDGSN